MNKRIVGFLVLIFLASGCSRTGSSENALPSASLLPTEVASSEVKGAQSQGVLTTISVDFGGGSVINGRLEAATAYDALQKVALQNNIKVDAKQYDFGVLVNSIGDKANTKDLAWIYYVNGKSPEVGADKYELKEGDKVEWKYVKPTF